MRLLALAVLSVLAVGCSHANGADSAISLVDNHPDVLQTQWYLPPGFAKGGDDVVVVGSGRPMGKLYAHSSDVPVVPGATYAVAATVDARSSHGPAPCFYLAERPSGKDLGIQCAVNGTVKRYTLSSFVPLNVHAVQWVAYIDDCRIDADKIVAFGKPELRAVKLPGDATKNLLSN